MSSNSPEQKAPNKTLEDASSNPPNLSYTFVPRYSDFDRNGQLPFSSVFRYCMEMRRSLLHHHATFRKYSKEGNKMMVKAQICRFIREVVFQQAQQEFTIDQYFDQVGGASFRFSYILYENKMPFARVMVAMINTVSLDGKTIVKRLPEYFKEEITWGQNDLEGTELLQIIPTHFLQTTSTSSKDIQQRHPTSSSTTISTGYPVLVRYSDEDQNKHTNASQYVKFIEDFLEDKKSGGENIISALWMEYVKETHANDQLLINFTNEDIQTTPIGSTINIKLASDSSLVCRAWCSKAFSGVSNTISNGNLINS